MPIQQISGPDMIVSDYSVTAPQYEIQEKARIAEQDARRKPEPAPERPPEAGKGGAIDTYA